MAPTLLIVGATGNTGVGVVQTVASELKDSEFKDYRIVGLTGDKNGGKAKELAKLPHVEMVEKDWTAIEADWLKEHEVRRIFVAPHNLSSAFADESLFLTEALEAGVEYVVRISTTSTNVGPNTPVSYARTHWAIETLLGQPEFSAMKWTSLQPNNFTPMLNYMGTAWIKTYRETGEKQPLRYVWDEEQGHAWIDPLEVGILAGKLLTSKDVSKHASKKYTLTGPSDMNGRQFKELIEKHAKTTIEEVTYNDTTWFDGMKSAGYADNMIKNLKKAPWKGWKWSTSYKVTQSDPEAMEVYTIRNHALDQLDETFAAA